LVGKIVFKLVIVVNWSLNWSLTLVIKGLATKKN